MIGGAGRDVLTGGTGADLFVLDPPDGRTLSLANLITDFEVGIDHLRLPGGISFDDLTFAHGDPANGAPVGQRLLIFATTSISSASGRKPPVKHAVPKNSSLIPVIRELKWGARSRPFVDRLKVKQTGHPQRLRPTAASGASGVSGLAKSYRNDTGAGNQARPIDPAVSRHRCP
nr:hypothetical protein [Novosphingobium sp. P6W]